MAHRYFVAALGVALLLSACSKTNSATKPGVKQDAGSAPLNIIMVVADGMGPAYVTAYRNFNDDPTTDDIERTVFDSMLVGKASTSPAKVSGYVTDSAASATALAAGVKSYNGAIGVDVNKKPLKTVLHQAKLNGKKTGLAVTSQVVHATPAAYVAANESRKNYNQIADSFFDDRLNNDFIVDVILGGGQAFFERDDRNLVAEFKANGYRYTDDYDALAGFPADQRLLGLFAPVGLPWALDDERKDRLSYLTKHAIKHLENPNGFFLLVEASQVDWAGHANDIGAAMAEMRDLATTMTMLKNYVDENPNTLVVLTADHSTGGMTIGAQGDYSWNPEWIKSMQASVATIAADLNKATDRVSLVEQKFGFKLDETERNMIKEFEFGSEAQNFELTLKRIIDARTNTGWTTTGHTGIDVDIFAYGKGHEQFRGAMDNTDIAKHIFKLLAQEQAKQ